ncbi:trypco2 family protein [Streptomyces sp. NPDC052101]|uniref:trypco2 family protein n=1 Tax=Streptomyces sp. NPDC052101 TaxID=3155763 RepID=UPI00343D62CC
MGISLSEALAELRRELYAAQAEGAHQQLRFEVEKAELSLELEFRQEGNGKAKVEVKALGAKAGAEAGGVLGRTRRQILTLTLQVRDEALGGATARISRSTGGLDTPDDGSPRQSHDVPRSDDGAGATVQGGPPQPWEE